MCLLECTNHQLAFKVPSAKSAFPQRKRGPEGLEGTCRFGRHSCLLQTLARHLTAAWPQFPQLTERENNASVPDFLWEAKQRPAREWQAPCGVQFTKELRTLSFKTPANLYICYLLCICEYTHKCISIMTGICD